MSNIVAVETRWKVEERTAVAATSAQKSAVIGITTTSTMTMNRRALLN
jgi:hypothetical protein